MQVIFSAVSSSHKNIVDHLLQHGGTFKPDWVIDNQEEGDNMLKKLIRDKNHSAVNILMDSKFVPFEDQHIIEALDFAKVEIEATKVDETDSANKKNKNYKSPKEKVEMIIKALEKKKKHTGDGEMDFEKEKNKVQKEKKEIIVNMKNIEREGEVLKENHRRDSLDRFRQRKATLVKREIELNKSKGPKEEKSPSISQSPSIETIELRLKNIKSDNSTVSQKKIKQILQLLEEKLPLKEDKASKLMS